MNKFLEIEKMSINTLSAWSFPAGLAIALLTTGCLSSDDGDAKSEKGQVLYVAHEGSLTAYDISTGGQIAGEIADVSGPTDMQALEDGTIMVNLSSRNEVLAFDGKTMLQKARIPSSSKGALKPTHSYITPTYGGKRYWMALNDGSGSAATNSAVFIDITPGSADYLKAVGEVGLGAGHHKAAFGKSAHRVVISNIADTNEVLAVFDYSNPSDIKKLASVSARGLGLARATPHGCGSSSLNGMGYCNLTASGDIVSVDLEAAVPAFKVLKTKGAGGGYTKGHGRYVYSLQTSPREGDTVRIGSLCQVGQIVVIDAQVDTVVNEVPLKYGGPNCADAIAGGPGKSAGPGHIVIHGTKMFVQMASSTDTNTYASKHLVLDLADPANPVQTGALDIGKSRSHHGESLSGDGRYFFVANNLDGTVTQIDAGTAQVSKTLTVRANPRTVATWGEAEGPSPATGPLE